MGLSSTGEHLNDNSLNAYVEGRTQEAAIWLSWPVVELAAVLSLVDDLRAENERLREALDEYGGHQDTCANRSVFGRMRCDCGWPKTRDALAGSPAANEEQQ